MHGVVKQLLVRRCQMCEFPAKSCSWLSTLGALPGLQGSQIQQVYAGGSGFRSCTFLSGTVGSPAVCSLALGSVWGRDPIKHWGPSPKLQALLSQGSSLQSEKASCSTCHSPNMNSIRTSLNSALP